MNIPSDFLERIKKQLGEGLPLVAYSKPGEASIKLILQSDNRLNHIGTFRESGFVFAPFHGNGNAILLKPDEIIEYSWSSSDGISFKTFGKENLRSMEKTSPRQFDPQEKASYLVHIEKAINEISKGTFQKVVLSRRLDIRLKTPVIELFQRLLYTYPQAFCYLWYHPKMGTWMGATPEILLQFRNRQLTTMSLAGTQAFKESENPIWGHKELEEQQLVTDYILDSLQGRVSRLYQGPAETVKAGNLLHLRTKITGVAQTEDLNEIIKTLHPTPAVCGLPKKKALDFISENEDYERSFYTGFLGELNLDIGKQRNPNRRNQENQAYRSVAKATTLYVNLRCMELSNDTARIFVGGGITKDSDPEKEWEETVAKSRTMLGILDKNSIL